MAAASPQNAEGVDKFSCPICLEIYEKPMTISCGHTFCNACLATFNNTQQPTCPMCRSMFHAGLKQKNSRLEKQIAAQNGMCNSCGKKLLLSKLRAHRANCNMVQVRPPPTFKPVAESSQPPPVLHNRSTFACPYCDTRNMDCATLLAHCNDLHKGCVKNVVCPICAAMPWGDPSQLSGNFLVHLNMRHKFEYDTFVDYEQDDDAMLENALRISLQQM